jgi:hypothetical protein
MACSCLREELLEVCEADMAAFAKELAAEVRNARNAPLNKFHSDSSNDAPCGGTQEKTTRASRTSAAGQRLLATSNASDGKAIEGACRLPSAGP